YYEGIGLLPPPRRAPNGYRDYDERVLDRLMFVRAAQADGFTLAEIQSIIAVRDDGQAPCGDVLALIDHHAADIDRRTAELRRPRTELAQLAERARTLDPDDCRPEAVCQIINTAPRSPELAHRLRAAGPEPLDQLVRVTAAGGVERR